MNKILILISLVSLGWGIVVGVLLWNSFISQTVSADINVSQECLDAWNHMADTYPGWPVYGDLDNPSVENDQARLEAICTDEELDAIRDELLRVMELKAYEKRTGQKII